jgi:hypothetical protein
VKVRLDTLFVISTLLLIAAVPGVVRGEDPNWKHQVVFPDDPYCAEPVSTGGSGWVKFTIKLDDPCTVYFQDSQLYVLHHEFATSVLDPFIGMSASQFYQVTLYEEGQQAALGTVIMPPLSGGEPDFLEYGIQFIRQDPYTREEIAAMFEVVEANVVADPNVRAFYFPTYEQAAVAQANIDWFADQNIPVSSTARWAQGNICYSEGWALGELKYFGADAIDAAYHNGLLEPNDILLTDGVPAEIPFVAGVLSLSPSTPSSHVAILSQTYGVPFAYLAVAEDANLAQQLLGRTIALSSYDDGLGGYDVRLLDVEDTLTDAQIAEILELKKPPPLDISPMANCGTYSADTNGLSPEDINCFGGKASNFGILRTSIPDNSPNAVALSFDLWNEFLDQAVTACNSITIDPNGYLLFWADEDEGQGPMHADFKLSKNGGEDVGLYDIDGITLIDGIAQFPAQDEDDSYGRLPDGNGIWVYFRNGTATPGEENSASSSGSGLYINEFMADNHDYIYDNFGQADDWIELYNAGATSIDLGGMYLTDDMNEPTEWMIPYGITGSTLREEINNRLSGYTYPPSDMAALAADLRAVREMFKDTTVTSFTPLQIVTIESVLLDPQSQYGFDLNEKLRFRSSTNVEDSEQFTGAGLYSSYSGCLADEFDGDEDGPCICDPCEDNERGVFRAIRKVFASFYNDNAFLERLRYDINEAEVGMALLVHHSFPDEIELANGVATLDKRGSGANMYITLVTQDGAVSVTNPDPNSIPEEVTVRVYTSGTVGPPKLIRSSNLVPLGATVMDWDQDYRDLADLLIAASNEFSNVTGKTTYLLDLEYKKVSPGGAAMPAGGLVVKQIREVPQPNDVPSITPFLINQPTEYCIFSGEYELMESTDVFADHRLKSRWTLTTKSVWLDEPNLTEGFYADANIEYFDGNSIQTINEPLPLLPFAYHDFDGMDANDGWTMDELSNPRTYELLTENIPTLVSPAENPLLTLRDFGTQPFMLSESRFRVLRLQVGYDQPVRAWAGDDCSPVGLAGTMANELHLWRIPQESSEDILEQYSYDANGISITTDFYRPPPPENGDWSDSTAPIARWVQTTIEGYTTVPIDLAGYYSQTYHAWHHTVKEYFLFEPRLEPGISQDTLDQLQAQNVRLIHLTIDNEGSDSNIETYGFEFVPGDFNEDSDVDFLDFGSFAQHWLESNCCACGGVDLTGDRRIQLDDLRELADNWLASAM